MMSTSEKNAFAEEYEPKPLVGNSTLIECALLYKISSNYEDALWVFINYIYIYISM